MEGRSIIVKLAGSGEQVNKAPLYVTPGTTPEDVMKECGLSDYDLFVERTGEKLEPGEDVYAKTRSGDILLAGTPAEVGVGILPTLRRFFIGDDTQAVSNRISNGKILRSPDGQLMHVVKKAVRPYWIRNWVKKGNDYRGCYCVNGRRFRGEIKKCFGNTYEYFIYKPPAKLKKHTHSACFSHKGRGKWSVHFSSTPKDVSCGILTIEEILREALYN